MGKKILVLTPRFPYPLIGGDKIRIYNICKGLSEEGNNLTLLSFIADSKEAEFAESGEIRKVFNRTVTVLMPKWKSYLNALLGLFKRLPLQVSYYQSREMEVLVKKELETGNYDAVLVHLIRMAPYVAEVKGIKKVLEMTDALSLFYGRSSEQRSLNLLGFIYRIEKNKAKRYEQECIEKFDFTSVISEIDRNFLLKNSAAPNPGKIKIVPHGVSEGIVKLVSDKYDKNLVSFFGNMRTYQNTDMTLYFIAEIWPLIRNKNPLAKFYVIGNEPPKSIRDFDGKNGIKITGKVPVAFDYVKNSCVSICPMRVGAGVQTKILESMAMGVPVVTNSFGAEGIDAVSGQDFLVAEKPEDFANHVLNLMSDENLRERIGQGGKKVVMEKYYYPDIVRKYYVDIFN